MISDLFPSAYSASISDYDFEAAYRSGRRLLLYDIDNTLVPHSAPADEGAKAFFIRIRKLGFSCCAVSNNEEPRVRSFCEAVGSPYIFKAGKPGAEGFLRAMALAGAEPSETVFFGDQIFTDILGANRAGIESVLVKPVDRATDEPHIKLKRIFEKPVITAFLRSKNLAIEDYFR